MKPLPMLKSNSSSLLPAHPNKRLQTGLTLIELIIAIVIISIAAVAISATLGRQVLFNVDPMLQSQAQLLARSYLQEVSSKAFFDPSNDPRLQSGLTQAEVSAALLDQSQSASSNNRSTWDNLYEYHDYSDNIRDINGNLITELAAYQVAIDIDVSAGLTLDTLSNSSTCPATIARIDISVTDPSNQVTRLSGYRTAYWDESTYWAGGC
ncbi:prepilin-type N-terminal cleavage/methylation domain-containing protein [Reinekea thalattae]|uniref:Prepilin-type N-terminal cleavage/methylation domain-containing protein n=1 Tax=Reinekea thalattae TaxID=2593301 RepID=A0A5C8Z7Z7_9GAMM|nr:prepilin-type N-terminal cleavage/methylation domain-containing protein [Reinekea thalattae]TXR54225.1 prepilin-type N-terminal cleavage/methylation domain-containing protein [Reinekea thalattae]